MAGFLSICTLSIAMFVGCMVAGWIPLAFSLSQRKIQLLTIFGAGLLVGTSLAVIIPEGVEMMYGQHHHHDEHATKRAVIPIEPNMDLPIDSDFPSSSDSDGGDGDEHEHGHNHGAHHAVGVSLLVGFVFMLLVDQLGGAAHGHSHSHEPIRLDRLGTSEVGYERSSSPDSKQNKGTTATIGLVVHAAADGIAMGAAASTDRSDLQVIVFLAIMLHKAPAAFGLVSFLIHEGIEKRQLKKHLLVFALAAPVLTIVTYLFLDKVSYLLFNDSMLFVIME